MRYRSNASAATAALIIAVAGWSAPALGQPVAEYEVVDMAIPEPLTDVPGNPARGRQIVRDINRATCLICHEMPIQEEPDHGNIGPPLHGIGSRLSPGELRLRLVDSQQINPDTVMPPYHRVDGLVRVLAEFEGRPIYTAQQIEDVVAYLVSLREPAQ